MHPLLYSFRRCPYAIRARLAIRYSGVAVELREVALRDMPASLLQASPKATVPVLVLPDARVINESWDIVHWALHQHDPDGWMGEGGCYRVAADELIAVNDLSFKPWLDRYKYAVGYPEHPPAYYRSQAEDFLRLLEARLVATRYLLSDALSLADVGIFPFIRQFAFVDKAWFDQTPYRHLRAWLAEFLQSGLFQSVMNKYPVWRPGDEPVLWPAGDGPPDEGTGDAP